MIHRRLITLSFFLFAWFCVYLPVFSYAKIVDVKIGKEEGPVDIEADELSYERAEQVYHADGNVEVTRGDFNLRADHARLHAATNELTAWGNVLMSEGEDVLECERLEVNLETQLGKVYKARLFLKDNNYHISAEEAEKLGENQYRVREGSFTTCDAKRPPWKFTVKDLYVTLGGEGVARRAVFYFEDIPVLYLPWATIPLRKERETGFLLPQPGYSNLYGPQVKTGFYWAMTKEMDSTLYADYLGDRGFKEGLEYRYAFGRETDGEARFYFINDTVFGNQRYSFFLQNEQKLPSDFYLKGNINYVSDRPYLRDFNEDIPEGAKIDASSTRHLRSVLFGGKNWDQASFLAQGMFFQDLEVPEGKTLLELSNDATVQMLPDVRFYAHPQSLYKNIFFYDVTTSYTNFSRENGVTTVELLSKFPREEGVEAHRFDLFPRLSYPTRLLDVLKVNSSAGLRETYYYSFNDPENRIKGSESRETFEADIALSTEFYKVYDGRVFRWLSDLFNVERWMHTIEPTIGYRYIPRVDQDDLPRFDNLDRPVYDRIPYTNEITYGFTQRLVGKPQKEKVDSGPYEYAMLEIFQSRSLGDPYEKDVVVKDSKKRDFSSIQGLLTLRFNPYLTVRWDAGFDPYGASSSLVPDPFTGRKIKLSYGGGFDRLNTLIRIKDKRNDAFQIEYRFSKTSDAVSPTNPTGRINAINFHTRLKTVDPLYLYGGIRYNFQEDFRVESTYGLEYQAQCWTVGLTFEDRRVGVTVAEKNGPLALKRETSFQLYLNLLGLGGLGSKPKIMGL